MRIPETLVPVATAVQAQPAPAVLVEARSAQPVANDNRSLPVRMSKLVAPEDDVQRFYKERIETTEGSSLTASTLYEDYCQWCEENTKEPLALPRFGREFGELGIQKVRIAGRTRYTGVALKSGLEHEEDKKAPASVEKAA
jgi:phage/plasmid-associated DNA primase